MLLKKCYLNRVICVKRTLYISSVNYIRPQLSDENKALMKKGRDSYYRLLDGMPTADKAPHLKIIYSSSLKYVPYVYNPISILWTPCVASLTVFSNGDKILLCVALSYSIIIAAVVGKASHHIPLRLYVDEEKDTSIGIFVHPYIPFKMQKIEIPFHSLKIRESERLSTWNHFNHLGKYYLEEENFISRIYYQRLLSQNKPY